ncbi:MAG: hypothetical protein Q8P11_03140 [bacterium]|nr:hypothetical protein [bacterium]
MSDNYNRSRKESLIGRYIEDINLEQRIIGQARALADKLNREIEKGNDSMAFMVALVLAACKDVIDLVPGGLIGVISMIPVVGIAIAAALLPVLKAITTLTGFFFTGFIFFFLLGKGWFLTTRIKIIFWGLGLFMDNLPLIGELPMNIFVVLYAWRLVKKRARNGELKLRNLNNLTEKEIVALNKDISLLESDFSK